MEPKLGFGVILGSNVQLGANVIVWNYVVIGDNTRIGDGTRIGSFCDIGRNVEIGRECNIQAHVTISNGCRIGDRVFIGPKTVILNDKYPISDLITPPTIGNDVIIGGGAIIMPNIMIGDRAVIAAGSIVTRSVDAGIVVKGAPAKPFMNREEYEAKRKKFIRRNVL
ncbi:MAG: acyltransferase [Candidatus Bathyarchaeia archaeon]